MVIDLDAENKAGKRKQDVKEMKFHFYIELGWLPRWYHTCAQI